MNSFRSNLIKLIIFLVVAVTITISVIATLLDLKLGQPQTGYNAVFTNASDLESGDTVRIAGVEVGKVSGVGLKRTTRDGVTTYTARVSFTVASSEHLTTNSTAQIEFENLLGQRYLQISQGASGGDPLRGGSTIPQTQTTPGLDLTTVFTGFQPLLAALNPTQINQLTASLVDILQGQSGAVGNLINQTATLTQNLAQRGTVIDEILDNLTPLLTNVNGQDKQLTSLITGLNSLVGGLAQEKGQVGDAVTGLSNLTTNASHLLTGVQPTLNNDLGQLDTATGELLDNQAGLNSVITDLPALLNALDKASDSGSYLSVYVCDLTLNTSGPISTKLSAGVPQSPPLSVPTGLIGFGPASDQASEHTPVCSGGAS